MFMQAWNASARRRVVGGVNIDIWSDVVCPWCYVGKRRFEAALGSFEHADAVTVTWHSFQLDPSAGSSPSGEHVTQLATKYGRSIPQAQQMLDSMAETAAAEGLKFRFDIARGANTFDAHRLLHLAHEVGRQNELKEMLFSAAFEQGQAVDDHETLRTIAIAAGLPDGEVEKVLDSDRYADEVRADVRQAQRLQITGVPFFVVDGRYGVSGAQSSEVLRQVLDRAWNERAPLTVLSGSSASCEGGSCAV